MAIVLAENFTQELDQHLRANLKTGVLDNNAKLSTMKWLDAKTVKIPHMVTGGLLNYTRGGKIATSNIDVTVDTYTLRNERAKSLFLDALDSMEQPALSISNALEVLMNEYVIPEIDATRISAMHGALASYGVASQIKAETLTTATAETSIIGALNDISDNEGATNESELIVFASYKVKSLIEQNRAGKSLPIDGTFDGKVNNVVYEMNGSQITYVPSSRMYTAIDLLNTGNGGYAKSATAKDINFIIANKEYAWGMVKHETTNVHEKVPGYIGIQVDYLLYHDLIIPKNKISGFYSSTTV